MEASLTVEPNSMLQYFYHTCHSRYCTHFYSEIMWITYTVFPFYLGTGISAPLQHPKQSSCHVWVWTVVEKWFVLVLWIHLRSLYGVWRLDGLLRYIFTWLIIIKCFCRSQIISNLPAILIMINKLNCEAFTRGDRFCITILHNLHVLLNRAT